MRRFIGIKRLLTLPCDACKRGVTAVEFALIAPVFFMIMMGIVEVSLVMLTQHLMDNTMFNASRTAKTGYTEDGKTQLDTVVQQVTTELGSLAPLIDVSKISFSYASYGSLTDINQPEAGQQNLGTAQQVVVFTLTYPWHFFTPIIGNIMGDANRDMTLTSKIVVRNEPYND